MHRAIFFIQGNEKMLISVIEQDTDKNKHTA